jgi:hypothetical protein
VRAPGATAGRQLHLAGSGILCCAVAGYLVARAVNVPLTYDEASSFFRYVQGAPVALFDFATATNHLLNSILTWLAVAVFGDAPWAMRLPNLMAGFGFLTCAASLTLLTRHRAIGVAGCVLLATNPYLLDYFALSRGYGLAAALLTVGMVLLVRWCERPAQVERPRDARLALSVAGAAVAASYSALPAFVGMVVVACWRSIMAARGSTGAKSLIGASVWTPRAIALWLLLTAAFSGMVFGRARVLSAGVFVPVSLRATGLFEDEIEKILVFWRDATGRLQPVPRAVDGHWELGPEWAAWDSLVVNLPPAVDRNLASLDLAIGGQSFRRDHSTPGPWVAEDAGPDRVLTTTSDAAWHTTPLTRRHAALHAALVVIALATCAAGLVLVSHLGATVGVIAPADARWLSGGVLWVASVTVAPIVLLQSYGELFFGGTSGLVPDMFGTLVAGSFYGGTYYAAQVPLALSALGVCLLAPPVLFALSARARREPVLRRPAVVLAVVCVAALQAALQHRLFGTPYPFQRTALFLLPLLLLYVVLLADALATFGRVAMVSVSTVLVLLAAGSAWHFLTVANVTHALDWPSDGSTEELFRLLERRPASERRQVDLTRVGVEWQHYPVARYYAARASMTGATRYDVTVLPGDGRPLDYVYANAASDFRKATRVQQFPASGTAVWHLEP